MLSKLFSFFFLLSAIASFAIAQVDPSYLDELLQLMNVERQRAGLPPLCRNDKLASASQIHADDMAKNNFFSLTGSDGSTAAQRAERAGFRYNAIYSNVAAGYREPKDVMKSWSAKAFENYLNKDYTYFGGGYAYNINARYKDYWVGSFGSASREKCSDGSSPTPSPTITPVPTRAPTPPPGTNPPGSSSFEEELVQLMNVERAKVGLPALCINKKLSQASQVHADDMASHNFFSNTGSDGSDPFFRMERAGFRYTAAYAQIAAGARYPEDVMKTWKESARDSYLSSDYTYFGSGYAYDINSRYRDYWVASFGSADREKCSNGSTPPLPSTSPSVAPPVPSPTNSPVPSPTGTAPPSTFETELLRLINAERAKAGLTSMCLNRKLTSATQAHALDMATRDFFGHIGSDGSSPQDRLVRAGFKPRRALGLLAGGYSTPREAFDFWMKPSSSGTPEQNILNPNLRFFAAGYAYSATSTYKNYWVGSFADSDVDQCN